jgi:hypothetical protein
MGVFGASENKDGKNTGFGNLVTLRPINNNNDNNTTIVTSLNKNKNQTTRIMEIPEPLYRRFVEHSRRYYNVESYETILENLITYYEEHNKDKYWFDNK